MFDGYSFNHIAVGVLGGIFCTIIVIAMIPLVIQRHASLSGTTSDKVNAAAAFIGVVLSVVALSLVAAWAYTPYGSDVRDLYGYLGEPSFSEKNTYHNNAGAQNGYTQPLNVLAWHPVFMVGGFFWSQAIAISAWSVLPSYKGALAVHIIFQLAAVATLIAGLCAVAAYKYRKAGTESSVTSMHSWAGILTVVAFGTQFLVGIVHGALKSSGNALAANVKHFHKNFGIATFGSTAVTIVSGIMNFMNRPDLSGNYCQNVQYGATKVTDGVEVDPARHYNWLPNACKIANGLGITVIITVFALVYAVSLRTPFPEEIGGTVKEAPGVSSDEIVSDNDKKTVDEENRA